MKRHRVVVIAAAVGGVFPALAQADVLSPKRGFADVGANYNNLQATGAGWYYTWGTGAANPGNFDAKHYPMFWNGPSQGTIDNVKARNPEYVLGFNEPERPDQANMTVAQAIAAWTPISNSFTGTSTKLVSPAVADTGGATGGQQWLANFMSQASAAQLKVDAVAFHWYGVSNPNNPAGAASSFLSRVDSYFNSYGKPVFITEFAIHDWGGVYTDAEIIEANRQFLNIVIPGLESRSHVAGYAWYHWFNDAHLYDGSPMTPTPMAYSYVGAIGAGRTENVGGKNLGEHVAYLTGGTLTMTGSAGTVRYINALANVSTMTGGFDWGLNSPSNWVRIQPNATLRKTGSNAITFAGPVTNNGILDVAQGVLRLGATMSGNGFVNIPSTGDAIGSTARLELTGNIAVSNPIFFSQRNDPGGSDGIRNVSGNNTLSGPMTITVGGNQARVRSDAGQLTLAGAITTNATSARNIYLQGAGNGVVSGVISDNNSDANGKINLFKEGSGTWTLTAPNTYTGTTTVNAGVFRLANLSTTAVASYSFDNVSGSTVVNDGTGGAGMNGTLAGGANILPGGRFGNAVRLFSGASVNINSSIADLGNAASWTVSAWVRTAAAGSSILTKGDGSGWSSGNTIFYLGDGTGPGSGGIPSGVRHSGGFFQGSTSATSVVDGTWHQVSYVNDNGTYAIYVDGVLQPLSAGNSGFVNADVGSVVRLGVSTNTVPSDGTVNYNGLLDSVEVYSQALTPAQIAAIYQGQSLGSTGLLPPATAVTIGSGATLDVNGTTQQIASLSGAVGSAVTLGTGQSTVSSSNSTQFAGAISGNGGSLVKGGAGVLTLAGANTYTGGTTVGNGTLVLATTGSLASAGALTTNGTGTFAVAAGRSNAVKVSALSVDNTASAVDLNDNDLIVGSATPTAAVVALVSNARNGGAWDMPGLTSSAARANASTNLGILTGAEYDSVGGGTGTFAGQSYAPDDTLIKYTWNGDANFNGVVNFDDYVRIDVGFNTGLSGWVNGDFNYSGSVNFDDYVMIDVAFNTQNGTLGRAIQFLTGEDRGAAGPDSQGLSEVTEHFDQFGAAYAQAFLSAVPEPSVAPLLGTACPFLRRRRTHQPAARILLQ